MFELRKIKSRCKAGPSKHSAEGKQDLPKCMISHCLPPSVFGPCNPWGLGLGSRRSRKQGQCPSLAALYFPSNTVLSFLPDQEVC